MYGRYEYRDDKSDKFWTIEPSPDDPDMVRASWGKNGRPPQAFKDYPQSEARSKLNEKIAKGYRKVGSGSPFEKEASKASKVESKKRGELADFLAELKKI